VEGGFVKKIMGIFIFLPFLTSNRFKEEKKDPFEPSAKVKIEENPRNRAFVESFQRIHSYGVIQRQEEKKQKKNLEDQKASP
jgi:hypothetical protein